MSKGLPREDIIAIQTEVGTTPDGEWGPKSKAACKAYLQSLKPKPNPWPKQNSSDLIAFYGRAGDESKLVLIETPFVTYYERKPVKGIRIHRRCAESLVRVFNDIKDHFITDSDVMDEAQVYDGAYNFRDKRGSSSLSLHAFGAAIDMDANENSYKDNWPVHGDMNWEIIKAFAREGWVSAAGEWNSDPMHFQATQSVGS